MRYLLAILLPWISFFTIGQPISAVICLILQITLLGWPIAALWALFAVNSYYADRRAERMVGAMQADRGHSDD